MGDPFNSKNFFVPLLGAWDVSVKKIIIKNLWLWGVNTEIEEKQINIKGKLFSMFEDIKENGQGGHH